VAEHRLSMESSSGRGPGPEEGTPCGFPSSLSWGQSHWGACIHGRTCAQKHTPPHMLCTHSHTHTQSQSTHMPRAPHTMAQIMTQHNTTQTLKTALREGVNIPAHILTSQAAERGTDPRRTLMQEDREKEGRQCPDRIRSAVT
jgi:hypothetical protein